MKDITIFPADIAEMSVGQLAALPSMQKAEIDRNLDEALDWLKKARTKFDAALDAAYGEQARTALRESGRDFGTAHISDGPLHLKFELPKKVSWDQRQLTEIAERIVASGEKVEGYLDIKLSVSESRFTNWPPALQQQFAAARTVDSGKRWAESKLKNLTGGDKISARFMRQDFFEFFPQFKLFVAGNHRPAIRNIDEAMKRRLHLIPFTITVPPERRDKNLQQKLLAERDGILAWAVQGCLDWQRHGRLSPPQRVVDATEEYFEAEDALGRWIDERCVREANAKSLTAELFNDWKPWAEAAGEFTGSQKRFADLLLNRGLDKWRNGMGLRGFQGIGLKYPPAPTYTPYADD